MALTTFSFLATFLWLDLMPRRMDEYMSWTRRKLLRVAERVAPHDGGGAAVVATAPSVAATLSEMVARKQPMDM
ncbi:Os12g0268666 [Oryza sativa Japonica Group]|uniref:Os12g0268666 protein n=1 Tax=Oryza sativa subsp. japonica TaxID=39947 RepID=A0A0P0Y8U9_ORYSJ|nr:Os12g0268666 [Oryza sativa Japonica Group]